MRKLTGAAKEVDDVLNLKSSASPILLRHSNPCELVTSEL